MTSPRMAAVEPDPLPFPEGEPERGEQWSPGGAPPTGIEFLGCRGTLECWLAPCPSCLRGWVAVVPDGTEFGYRVAVETGCSRGCAPELVAWWEEWRMGQCPPPPPASETQRRYARGAVRRALGDALSGNDVLAAARDAGRYVAAAGLVPEHLAEAFARAGKLPQPRVHAALLAGAATPGRLPDAR